MIPLCLNVSLNLKPLDSEIFQGTLTTMVSPASVARAPLSRMSLPMIPFALAGSRSPFLTGTACLPSIRSNLPTASVAGASAVASRKVSALTA